MSPKEIDRLVARYLDGDMSLAEEEEFFVRMALDDELRRSYRALRIVESALSKGRQHIPRPSPDARRHVVALASASAASGQPRNGAHPPRRWRRDLGVVAATVATGAALFLGLGIDHSDDDDRDATMRSRPTRASEHSDDDRGATVRARPTRASEEAGTADSTASMTIDEPAGSAPAIDAAAASRIDRRDILDRSDARAPSASTLPATADANRASNGTRPDSTDRAAPPPTSPADTASRSRTSTLAPDEKPSETVQSSPDSVRIGVSVRLPETREPEED